MNKLERIIQILKKLDKSNICFDKDGRLLIKPSEFSAPNKPLTLYKEQIRFTQRHTNLFTNFLLHPEDRIRRKNLNFWIDDLSKEIETLFEQNIQISPLSIATLYNQASLASCLMGEVSMAIKLCEKQMDVFFGLSKENPKLLKYLLQPWINLGRIDRIIKAFDESLEKFKTLNFLSDNKKSIHFGKYHLNGNLLREEIRQDRETFNIIRTCTFLEPIKTYLSASDYQKLINLLDLESIPDGSILLGIAYEASIIAHVYKNMLNDANKLVKEALIKVPPYLMPLFLLRQGALYAICHDSRAEAVFNQILDYINYCDRETNDIHQAIFTTKASEQFLRFGYKELAKKAYKKSLSLCEAVDDELSMVECLEALNKLTTEKQYANQLKQLTYQSGYASIVHKYQSDKKSLKSLQIKSEILFAKLMNISILEIGRKLNA